MTKSIAKLASFKQTIVEHLSHDELNQDSDPLQLNESLSEFKSHNPSTVIDKNVLLHYLH
jgi:hypothetical protein